MKNTGKLLIVIFTFLALTASAYAADDSPLFEAVRRGDKAAVEALLAKGADVNAKGEYGYTPLHEASRGQKDIAGLLLAKGADVNAKDNYGKTPLSYGVTQNGNTDLVKLLLAKGADINIKSRDGFTPLLEGIGQGKSDFAELMENHILKQAKNHRELFGQLSQKLEKNNINRPRSLVLELESNGPSQGSGIQLPTANFIRSLVLQLDDISTRRLILKLASELKPAPAIPEEARKHFIEGTAIVKAAKNPAQQAIAAQSFTEALKVAPWWGDAYYNLGVAQELAEKYDEAEQAFNFYLLSKPGATEKREVQDRIYALSAKRKLLGAK
ncbi:MAG: ankyrin repeat domain-containing protein [Sulfuricaulis sp.]